MARILYAWELGGGLGHTHRLAELSQHPTLSAHQAVFAVPAMQPSAAYLGARQLQCIQAPKPVPTHPPGTAANRAFRAGSYGDILAWFGFADERRLRRQLDAWRQLLDTTAPDLVVAESAPTLMLAARGRVPALAVGNGFTTPPEYLPAFPDFPDIGDGHRAPPLAPQPHMHALLRRVLDNAPPAAEALPGWFAGVGRVPLVYPFLDPYGPVRRTPAAGPEAVLSGPLPWPIQPRIFAYLAGEYAALPTVLDALEGCGAEVEVHVRNSNASLDARLRRGRFHLVTPPFKPADVLSRCSLVVSHAAIGTVHGALQTGRPQVVLPFQLENTLVARQLMHAGLAHGLGFMECAKASEVLAKALADAAMAARAQEAARRLRAGHWPGASRVAALAEPWLARADGRRGEPAGPGASS